MDKKIEFKKNGKNIGSMSLSAQDNDSAKLYFYGDIVSESWESDWYKESKCPQDIVDFFAEIDRYKAIDIYINSYGGSVFAGLAIYNILKRHQGKKTVYIDGIAASIASVIALAGDEVFCPSNAQLMIHKPWLYIAGNADDIRKAAEQLDVAQESIVAVYMQYVKDGITEEQVNQMVNAETWLIGEKAAEVFNITVTDAVNIAACAHSTYIDKYKNVPEAMKKQDTETKNNDEVERLRLELDLICL